MKICCFCYDLEEKYFNLYKDQPNIMCHAIISTTQYTVSSKQKREATTIRVYAKPYINRVLVNEFSKELIVFLLILIRNCAHDSTAYDSIQGVREKRVLRKVHL